MTPGRHSRQREFTPVPSHGSIFVYMIPPQNVEGHTKGVAFLLKMVYKRVRGWTSGGRFPA